MLRFKLKVSPKFHTRRITDSTIGRYWLKFQQDAIIMGFILHGEMRKYIRANARKRAGSTGNLAKSINFEFNVGSGSFSWGIGNIDVLNQRAKYWYVINYGRTVYGVPYIPNYGNFVPGYFSGGSGRPDSSKRGAGKESFFYRPNESSADREGIGGMFPKTPISPINYISHTRIILGRRFRQLINKLKREKIPF
jgi:hypothetical protein